MSYDHRDPSKYTIAECAAAVGNRVTLVLTGEIVSAHVSKAGAFVKFKADERFGFPTELGFDLDVFEFDEECEHKWREDNHGWHCRDCGTPMEKTGKTFALVDGELTLIDVPVDP